MAPSHAPGSVDRSLLQRFFQQLQNDHGTRADEPLVSGQFILESVQLGFFRGRQPLVVLLVDQDATSGVPAVIPTARRRGIRRFRRDACSRLPDDGLEQRLGVLLSLAGNEHVPLPGPRVLDDQR
jgi:hypothetical protein